MRCKKRVNIPDLVRSTVRKVSVEYNNTIALPLGADTGARRDLKSGSSAIGSSGTRSFCPGRAPVPHGTRRIPV